MNTTFTYRTTNPSLPLTKDLMIQCNNQPIEEGSEIDIKSQLVEQELYRIYLKYFSIPSSSHQSICISYLHIQYSLVHSLIHTSILPLLFWKTLQTYHRRLFRLIEKEFSLLLNQPLSSIELSNFQSFLLVSFSSCFFSLTSFFLIMILTAF